MDTELNCHKEMIMYNKPQSEVVSTARRTVLPASFEVPVRFVLDQDLGQNSRVDPSEFADVVTLIVERVFVKLVGLAGAVLVGFGLARLT